MAGQTKDLTLTAGSIAPPLHHPLPIAKSAATIDQLSGGRLILGIVSKDRLDEYPAMGIGDEKRGEAFRNAVAYIRKAQESFPQLKTDHFGEMKGDTDVLPKTIGQKISLLMTGYSRQSLEWNAENADR